MGVQAGQQAKCLHVEDSCPEMDNVEEEVENESVDAPDAAEAVVECAAAEEGDIAGRVGPPLAFELVSWPGLAWQLLPPPNSSSFSQRSVG